MNIVENNPKRIKVIDFLKGVSISTIVIFHLSYFIDNIPSVIKIAAQIGGTGVHVFMLVSGFGLFYSHLVKPVSTRNFFKKRFSKIYIPYIIIIFVSVFFPFMYSGYDKFQAFLSHIFLFKMFSENYISSFGIQFWFISTIIQFYLIFNILIKLKMKLGNRNFLAFCMGLSLTWWIIVSFLGKSDIRIWNSFFLQYLWEFGIGIVFADLYYKKKIQPSINVHKSLLFLVGIICIGIYGYLGLKGGVFKLFNDIPALLGYGSLSLLVYKLNIIYVNNFFLTISKFSYEWYLVHILIFEIVYQLFSNVLPTIFIGILALLFSLVIAYLYNSLFNVIRLKKTNTVLE